MSHALRYAAGGELLGRRTAERSHQHSFPASASSLMPTTKKRTRRRPSPITVAEPLLPRRGPSPSRAALRSLEDDTIVSATLKSGLTGGSDGELASSPSSPPSPSPPPPPPPPTPMRGLLGRLRPSPSSPSAPASLVPVDVEPAPSNARRLFASVDIAAPSFVVWSALTDYEALGDFIPGLAENRCLARTASGATLLQVGEQSVALGLRFRARVVLDIQEHERGLPASLWGAEEASPGAAASSPSAPPPPAPSRSSVSGAGGDAAWARSAAAGLFPQPRSGLPCSPGRVRDISFALIEGDFAAFRGVWRVQDDRGGAAGAAGAAAAGAAAAAAGAAAPSGPRTRLSYALYVRPQPWLPVHLVQGRIRAEVAANLDAVRAHTERVWRGE
jgi:hypothetical protein